LDPVRPPPKSSRWNWQVAKLTEEVMAMATRHETHEKEVFELVRKFEETVVEAGRKWAKAIDEAMPVELPMVRELVKAALDFTEAMLKAQRDFAHGMVKATTPTSMQRRRATRASTPKTTGGATRKVA
jgi:Cu2+-containing amine oxidase